MLSILIPTYNYNTLPLIQELESQALKVNLVFELICIDDGSFSLLNEENQKINALTNCIFIENKKNVGRSRIRNLLAEKAKYDWLLFLDADVMPLNNKFLSLYLDAISIKSKVIYGGIAYQEKPPGKDNILRWTYGKKREALSVDKRQENPYLRFLTLSFLIKKEVFKKVKFNEDIPNNRHEDTLFAVDLKNQKIGIEHIDNPVYHHGIETNEEFLDKSLRSVESLLLLTKQGFIDSKHVLISKSFGLSKLFLLNHLLAKIYKTFKAYLERNLLSEKPSLFIFDLYRLCYLCYLDKKD